MPVFVKASTRAGKAVKAYLRKGTPYQRLATQYRKRGGKRSGKFYSKLKV